MRIVLKLLLTVLIPAIGVSQETELIEKFNEQIEAFNARDIDKLVANVSEDFVWYYIASDSVLPEVKGKAAFKEAMVSYFKTIPSVRSVIESKTIVNGKVSFKETVYYTNTKGIEGSASAMGIYQYRDGLIYRAWYFME